MLKFLPICKNVDLILNVVLVFVWTDPRWPCSKIREIFSIDSIVFVQRPHDEEILSRLVRRNIVVSELIKVIMDNLSNVNDAAFLDLGFRSQVQLDS